MTPFRDYRHAFYILHMVKDKPGGGLVLLKTIKTFPAFRQSSMSLMAAQM